MPGGHWPTPNRLHAEVRAEDSRGAGQGGRGHLCRGWCCSLPGARVSFPLYKVSYTSIACILSQKARLLSGASFPRCPRSLISPQGLSEALPYWCILLLMHKVSHTPCLDKSRPSDVASFP